MLCIAMITSCRKDPTPLQPKDSRLLLRVAAADNSRMDKFQYDAQGKVLKLFYYRGYGDTAYQDYTYKNSQLHRITHYNTDFTEYYYTGDTLKKMGVGDTYNGIRLYVEYHYRNGKLDREQTFQKDNAQWQLMQERTYDYDAKGNVHKVRLYMGSILRETVEYALYSDHPDPLQAILQHTYRKGPQAMPRLVEKEIHYDENGNIEWTTDNRYEYDTKGYPVKRETTSRNPDNHILARHTVFYSYGD